MDDYLNEAFDMIDQNGEKWETKKPNTRSLPAILHHGTVRLNCPSLVEREKKDRMPNPK